MNDNQKIQALTTEARPKMEKSAIKIVSCIILLTLYIYYKWLLFLKKFQTPGLELIREHLWCDL